MAGTSDSATTPAPPDDLIGRGVWHADRTLRPLENLMNLIAAAATMLLVLMGVVSVIMQNRYTFNSPIKGIIDVTELIMPILAILGVAYCLRTGTHIRMDILVQRFSGRLLWIVETFAALCIILIALVLARFAWTFFMNAYEIGDTTSDIYLDTWPSKLLIPLAFLVLAVRAVIQFLGALRLAVDPTRDPVAVVVQKDIAEQAQDEIREAMGGEEQR